MSQTPVSLQSLQYAVPLTEGTRFSTPMVIWALVAGALALATAFGPIFSGNSINPWPEMRELAADPHLVRSRDAWMRLAVSAFHLRCIAGLLVFAAVARTWRQGWKVSPSSLRLFYAAGLSLAPLVPLTVVINLATWMSGPTRWDGSSVVSIYSIVVYSSTPILLLLASSRPWFHASPRFARCLVAGVILAMLLPDLWHLYQQVPSWLAGQRPWWLQPLHALPQGNRSMLDRWLVILHARVAMPLYYLQVVAQLGVVVTAFRARGHAAPWLVAVGVLIALGIGLSLGMTAARTWAYPAIWDGVYLMPLRDWFQLLLAFAAWTAAKPAKPASPS